MPKMTERERLADREARQRRLAAEIEDSRRIVRGDYASLVTEMAVETISEREFREVVAHAIRVGGGAAVAALKALPTAAS